MSIPLEIKQAYQQGYRQFSWVVQLKEKNSEPFSYFEKSSSRFYGERFYWETPEKDLILIGFGKEQEITREQASFVNLKKRIKVESEKCYQNQVITGAGALFFGGFPFDEGNQKDSFWGEMAQGLFYLPTFMLTVKPTGQYLTLNFSAETATELEEKWHTLQATWQAVTQQPVSEISIAADELATEEIGVPDWLALVAKTVEKIKTAGPLEKVVLARQMKVTQTQPFCAEKIVRNLQQQQTNTYFFILELGGKLFIGATPERLLAASKTAFSTACVAGSMPRGKTSTEDEALGNYLLKDEKNRQEHQIVVKRIATELQQLTKTPILEPQPKLLKNSDIQHLFIPIKVERPTDVSFLDGVQTLHPTPALGGEPKELALDWIKDNEPMSRGLYGAPIGWVSVQEDIGEFAVGIRSAFFSGNQGYLYAGCGIVKDSQAELEREETKVKFKPMLRGIGGKSDS